MSFCNDGLDALGGNHQTAIVIAAVVTHRVWAMEFAAVCAFDESFNFKRIMRTPIATAMRGYFSLRDSHGSAISSNKIVAKAPVLRAFRSVR